MSNKLKLPNNSLSHLDNNMTDLDYQINEILEVLNLPTQNIASPVKQRSSVFKNLEDITNELNLNKDDAQTKIYISKYVYAITNGLFDAALNYLWDAVISKLKNLIINFDLDYFFNNLDNPKKSSKKDLSQLSDKDLLSGAKNIDILSEDDYAELSIIEYKRNKKSAAHENDRTLTGIEMAEILQQCINHIFNKKISPNIIKTKNLLSAIKDREFNQDDISIHKQFIENLNVNQIDQLVHGFFGIYVNKNSTISSTNIKKLIPTLWSHSNEDTKIDIGSKYGQLAIDKGTDNQQTKYAKEFLEIVNGLSLIPDPIKVGTIKNILEQLINATNSPNNFYTEPHLVKELDKYLSENEIPTEIEKQYLSTIIYCYLTNGYGVAWEAEPYYEKILYSLNNEQAITALKCILDRKIAAKLSLSNSLIEKKFKKFLSIIQDKIINENYKKFIEFLLNLNISPIIKYKNDSIFQRDYKKLFEEI